MMNPDKPDKPAAGDKTDSESVPVAVRRIALQTAPELPEKLLKQILADKPEKADTEKEEKITRQSAETETDTDTDAAEVDLDEPDRKLNNRDTDKAVDDIVANEGDIVLAVTDAATARRSGAAAATSSGWKDKLAAAAKSKWMWVGLAVIVLAVFAVPLTRYKILGLAIKQPVSLTIVDSKSKTPVSNAIVQLGSASAKTDANGKVQLKAPVGKDNLTITKQYYTTAHSSYFVGLKAASGTSLPLVATGRLVPVTVINTITGKPLKGAEIHVLKTTAKTDAKGMATIALPAGSSHDSATVQLGGYNRAQIVIEVTDKAVKSNTFHLTPAGHIYFLSNLHGSLDVVKSNLDGSDRHTVLEGTGKEDKNTTSLLASRDWRYLVLKARRDSEQPALYLIDTSDDKVTQFDNGNAEFSLIGWYGHSLIYDLTRTSVSNWQPGREVIKSYDAENLQLNQLDQTQADGNAEAYAQQSFSGFYIVSGALVYNTQWYGYSSGYVIADLTGKTNTIRAINPNGQNKKDYQSFDYGDSSFGQAILYKPESIYYSVYNKTSGKITYYEYENQTVKLASDVNQDTFSQVYPTYLLSPSGNKTFWTELRDGKNTLFTGDDNAKGQQQIASLSDYAPYGWYGDAYTLVSKNSSELYIMPSNGAAAGKPPLKITDYYKPAQTFRGYGYGYGGL